MNQHTKPTPGSRVVPFTGEFYQPAASPTPPERSSFAAFLLLGLCLLGAGAALGATAAYNSPEQVQLRQLQAEAAQLTKLKQQICK